jgi:hypothetical protein
MPTTKHDNKSTKQNGYTFMPIPSEPAPLVLSPLPTSYQLVTYTPDKLTGISFMSQTSTLQHETRAITRLFTPGGSNGLGKGLLGEKNGAHRVVDNSAVHSAHEAKR